jgi:methylamine dehydrogenase heavy chain
MIRSIFARLVSVSLAAAAYPAAAQQPAFSRPLAAEATGNVAELPAKYPDTYVFVSDLHFSSLLDGRAALIDVADPTHGFKGQLRLAQFGNFLVGPKSGAIYTAETFFSRLTRGERVDVLTIWDPRTLSPKGEVILPGNKRGHFVTQPNALQFTNDEKWALVYNFTPAASVTVVDLDGLKVLGEVGIPGCALVYPTGPRGFSTLCGDGAWTTVELNADGSLASSKSTKPLMDIDKDPWFMIPARAGRTDWFVSYLGEVRGFDLSGTMPKPVGNFSLVAKHSASPGPRPGGWQVATTDPAGHIYVLMNPNGREGTHKDGGSEVWVADPVVRKVTRRITLRESALSIEVTLGANPLLVAAQASGHLDIYDAKSGSYMHTIYQAVHDPFVMSAAGK